MVKVNYTADNDGYHVDRYIEQGFVDFSSPAVVNVRKPVAIAPKPINQVTPVYVQRPVTLPPIIVKPQMAEKKENEEKTDYDLVASICLNGNGQKIQITKSEVLENENLGLIWWEGKG